MLTLDNYFIFSIKSIKYPSPVMKLTYAGVSRTDSMGNLSIIFQNMQ